MIYLMASEQSLLNNNVHTVSFKMDYCMEKENSGHKVSLLKELLIKEKESKEDL
jgi:hypothetical protein